MLILTITQWLRAYKYIIFLRKITNNYLFAALIYTSLKILIVNPRLQKNDFTWIKMSHKQELQLHRNINFSTFDHPPFSTIHSQSV